MLAQYYLFKFVHLPDLARDDNTGLVFVRTWKCIYEDIDGKI